MTRCVEGCDLDILADVEGFVVRGRAGDGFAVFAADDGDRGGERGEDLFVATCVVPVVVRVDDRGEVEG